MASSSFDVALKNNNSNTIKSINTIKAMLFTYMREQFYQLSVFITLHFKQKETSFPYSSVKKWQLRKETSNGYGYGTQRTTRLSDNIKEICGLTMVGAERLGQNCDQWKKLVQRNQDCSHTWTICQMMMIYNLIFCNNVFYLCNLADFLYS